MAASEEALEDAGWKPTSFEEREATGICLGSGIGNFDEIYDTVVAYDKGGYRKVSPLFVPKLLINLGAGHLSMRYGFMVSDCPKSITELDAYLGRAPIMR
jgi:3-oxoacyl-[acyl-carrier-protein] synthase II